MDECTNAQDIVKVQVMYAYMTTAACVNKNIVKPPVMCNLSRTNMLTNIHTHAEKETNDFTRYKHAVNANSV